MGERLIYDHHKENQPMLHVPEYQIHEQIYESANSIVYRGQREADERPVILKVLKEEYPTPEERIRYRQEYDMTRSLNLDGVIKAYSLEKYHNSLVICLEDFGGQSLDIIMNIHQYFTLVEFLVVIDM